MPQLSSPINPDVTWRNAILPYVQSKNIYQCPSRDNKEPGADGFAQGYAANDSGKGVSGRPWAKASKVDDFPDPANLIALCEVDGGDLPGFNVDAPASGAGGNVLWVGHSGYGNYLLLEGHVKALNPVQAQRLWHGHRTKP